MTYTINVPSYQRPDTIEAKTLTTLDRHGIDRDRITVWVADEHEHDAYRTALRDEWDIKVGAPGLVNARIAYHTHHAPGTPIVNIDDDVTRIMVADGKKLADFPGNLDRFFTDAFATCQAEGTRLWGINAAANPMYLNNRYTVGLRYTIGALFGSYAGDPIFTHETRTGESSGEDFEATLMAFARDGATLRYDGVTIKTAYFAGGGIDAELAAHGIPDRQTDHHRRLNEIAARYPGIASTYTKAGGVTNIRLKPITAHQVPVDPTRWA